MDKLPAPRGASASRLRQQQPDATKDTHEAARRPRRLVTAIGWPIASAPIYRHACPFIPGGRHGFRTTRIWDGWPPAGERYERRWKRPVSDESSRRASPQALRLKPKRPTHNRRAVGWLNPNKN